MRMTTKRVLGAAVGALALFVSVRPVAAGDINDVQHILILMMENRTFDHFLGQLGTQGYYAKPSDTGCDYSTGDNCTNQEVDGLDCTFSQGQYSCNNSNPKSFSPAYPDASCAPDTAAGVQPVFHMESYCTSDTDHDWGATHHEFNECDPAGSTGLNDGFYFRNDGPHGPGDGSIAMGFYDDSDLPFYYSLASTFAIGDRYFCSVLGPTIPNRMYYMAATSFGHVHTAPDILPPPGNYTPETGTILDRLDEKGLTWKNYFQDLPQAGLFRPVEPVHFQNIEHLFVDLENPLALHGQAPGALPDVVFIDPPFLQPQVGPDATLNFNVLASDEHPPKNVQTGQQFVARVVHAVMQSPHWDHTALFILYDEHGGFYDHVPPPNAPEPDSIAPGMCPDATNGLLALVPPLSAAFNSQSCKGDPDPALDAPFDRLGFRVPFYVVSPFAKRHYVSHTVLDHTSLLKFIEIRHGLDPLTARDANANAPLDVFDFANPDTSIPDLADAVINPRKIADPRCFEGVEVF